MLLLLLLLLMSASTSAYLFSLLDVQLQRPSNESGSSNPQAYSASPVLLQSLAAKEEVIYEILQSLLKAQQSTGADGDFNISESQMNQIAKYLKYIDQTTGTLQPASYTTENTRQKAQLVSWNPVFAFQLMRRFTRDLKDILRSFDQNHPSSLHTRTLVLAVMAELGWPSEEDFEFLMTSILRIQSIYSISATEISEGRFMGRNIGGKLSTNECREMGVFALEKKHYTWSVEWLEKAKESAILNSEAIVTLIDQDLEKAISEHDKKWETSYGNEPNYFDQQIRNVSRTHRTKRRDTTLDFYEKTVYSIETQLDFMELLNSGEFLPMEYRQPEFATARFWGLCSGKNYQFSVEKLNLRCWYEHKRTPYLTISPVKSELLSEFPVIVQYYEVISEDLINKLKSNGSWVLNRARVGGNRVVADRTSMTAWASDFAMDPSDTHRIFSNMHAITGLQTVGKHVTEALQVAAYAVGTHYGLHTDYLNKNSDREEFGNRVATFMFYLNDVELGGATAFPNAGVSVKPVKGAAIYWNNMLSSGDSDERTFHGACPVIVGEKWAVNSWIRDFAQFGILQCHPQRLPVPYLINGVPIRFY